MTKDYGSLKKNAVGNLRSKGLVNKNKLIYFVIRLLYLFSCYKFSR